MSPFSNGFEKKWFFIMMFLYFFIIIPFPFYYNEEYSPVFMGIPNYIFGWLVHAGVVVVAIIIWRNQCMSRAEYKDLGEDE